MADDRPRHSAARARGGLDPEGVPKVVEDRGEMHGLSAREQEIVALICRGRTNQEIAGHLDLSVNTVKTYIRSAYRTIGARNRVDAVLWGIAAGLGPVAPKGVGGDRPAPVPSPGGGPADTAGHSAYGQPADGARGGLDGAAAVVTGGPAAPSPAPLVVTGDVTAILSHEMGTSLTAVLAYAEEALDRLGPTRSESARDHNGESVRHCLGRIVRGARRLDGLRRDLVTHDLLTSGQLQADPDEVTVRDHLESVAELAARPHHVDITCEPRLTCWVQPAHLDQMLANLLSNAQKYSGGGVSVRARAGDDTTTITVEDDGPGVVPEFRARLFTRFARAESTSAVPGTGLGLYIVQQLARANGGHASYAPTATRGSCFSITLPAVPPCSAESGSNASTP